MPTKRVDIKHVREHADFAAVLEHYGVKLRGTGPQRYALCPFHRERKGSFSAHLDKRIFQCFGCEAKGNVIDFVMQSDEVDAREAAIIVAEISNIDTAPAGASREGRARGKKSGKQSSGRKKAASSDPDDAAPQVTEKDEAPDEEAAAPPDVSENTPLS
ncbi:MAG: CHC2 zinc finger domain-containing protein, partial [Rhodospirillales bacterium]|nr:CHC2 zinc finger domain-containing protein [Rhodospirillales bacterium]